MHVTPLSRVCACALAHMPLSGEVLVRQSHRMDTMNPGGLFSGAAGHTVRRRFEPMATFTVGSSEPP